jgi:hypothetical protein
MRSGPLFAVRESVFDFWKSLRIDWSDAGSLTVRTVVLLESDRMRSAAASIGTTGESAEGSVRAATTAPRRMPLGQSHIVASAAASTSPPETRCVATAPKLLQHGGEK